MAVSNRERVARALEIAAEALGAFVLANSPRTLPPERNGRPSFESSTRRRVTQGGLLVLPYGPVATTAGNDRAARRSRIPFLRRLSRAEQNLAGELRDIRNRASHGAPFNFDDTYRALDTAERLLRAADQPAAADKIKAERIDLQRTQIEAETRRTCARARPSQGSAMSSSLRGGRCSSPTLTC